MKRLGIIGGMGPEATIDLFRKIVENTPANSDQKHIPIIIDNYPQIPDRTLYIKGEGESPLPFLFESMERLQKSGADCLCMPCNTAHYFIDKLRNKAKVPFISMIESVIEHIKAMDNQPEKIGLMATDGTIIGKIYHKPFERENLKISDFNVNIQKQIMQSIYTLKSGDKQEAINLFNEAFEKIKAERYDVLIAGCTEIPILVEHLKSVNNIKIIDATLCLARKVVQYCLT